MTAVARVLSPTDFGRLAVLQVVVTLLAGAAGLGLAIALTRQVAEATVSSREQVGAYIALALFATFVAGSAITLIYVAARSEVARQILQDREATMAVAAAAGAVLSGAIAANTQGALLGLEAFRSTALSQWSQGLGVGAGLLIGVQVGGLPGALVGLSIGTGVGAVASATLLAKELSERGLVISWRPSPAIWQSLWKPAAPAFAAFFVVSLALVLGQLALTRQAHGYAEVGVFNLAYRWHLAIMFVPSVVVQALLPALARLSTEVNKRAARRLFQMYVAGTLILTTLPALLVTLAARQILSLSGSYYAHRSATLVVLAVASIPSALNNVLSIGALGIGSVRAWLVSDIALAAALLATATVLVPTHAAVGLATAYLLAYIVTDAVLAYPVRQLFIPSRGQAPEER